MQGFIFWPKFNCASSWAQNVNRSRGSIGFDNKENSAYCLDTAERKVVEACSNELVMLVKRRLNRISSAQVMIKKSGSPRRNLFCRG